MRFATPSRGGFFYGIDDTSISVVNLLEISPYIYIRRGVASRMTEGEGDGVVGNIKVGSDGRPCVPRPVQSKTVMQGAKMLIASVGKVAVTGAMLGKIK